MRILVNTLGIFGAALMAAGLVVLLLKWRVTLYWWFRPALILAGAAFAAAVAYLVRNEFNLLAYAYIFLIALLILWQIFEAFITMAGTEWSKENLNPVDTTNPLVRRARALERSGDYMGAVAALDEYLEEAVDDARARLRLAGVLVKAGHAKRAIAVLTVAFAQAQEPKLRIACGIRLAELLLAVRRDPLAARAQLEQLKTIYAGTEHEQYVETLSARMMSKVAQGRYLRKKPGRPA